MFLHFSEGNPEESEENQRDIEYKTRKNAEHISKTYRNSGSNLLLKTFLLKKRSVLIVMAFQSLTCCSLAVSRHPEVRLGQNSSGHEAQQPPKPF